MGAEARSRVPDEYVVQRTDSANPPSLFLTVELLLDRYFPTTEQQQQSPGSVGDKALVASFLRQAFPRLELWYSWFNTTQDGVVPGSYR